jgi:hypothetical protein
MRKKREREARARTMVAPATATAGAATRGGRRAEAQPWEAAALLGFAERGGSARSGAARAVASRRRTGGRCRRRAEVGRFANAGLRERRGGEGEWREAAKRVNGSPR